MNTRRFYGIAEIAEALGVDRQLVTVWRRRSSHQMPPPDDELSSGPLWTAATIEPWIATTRARLAAEAAERAGAPDPRLVRQAVRRLFRLDRKSTRLNSSHMSISYAVFCLKKKKKKITTKC